MKQANKFEIDKALNHSFNNKDEVLKSNICGCYHCLSIFESSKIKKWIKKVDTAICPECRNDAVIGDASGFAIDDELLRRLNDACCNQSIDNRPSPIVTFDEFSKLVKRTSAYPINSDNLWVHKDAYNEVTNDDEDYAFARMGLEYSRGYECLTFYVDFFRSGIGVDIDSLNTIYIDYSEIATKEKDIAKQIHDLIACLSNGKLLVLYTHIAGDDSGSQALEIIKYDKEYEVIATIPLFQSRRKLKGKVLDITPHRNNYDIDAPLPEPNFLKLLFGNTDKKRSLKHNALTPLTSEEWDKIQEEHFEKSANEKLQELETWANKPNPPLPTFKSAYLRSTQWRHISLTAAFSGVLLINCYMQNAATIYWAMGFLGITFAMVLAIIKGKNRWFKIISPLSYVFVTISGYFFITHFIENWLYTLTAIVLAIDLLECLILDIIFSVKKLRAGKANEL